MHFNTTSRNDLKYSAGLRDKHDFFSIDVFCDSTDLICFLRLYVDVLKISFLISTRKRQKKNISKSCHREVDRPWYATIPQLTCSPRASNIFNQMVEAKRFEGVFLSRKVGLIQKSNF